MAQPYSSLGDNAVMIKYQTFEKTSHTVNWFLLRNCQAHAKARLLQNFVGTNSQSLDY
jgi:hypothetical protein